MAGERKTEWWCTKNDAPERWVACGWKDQNHGACVTQNNNWCPFFYENKDSKYPLKKGKRDGQ